MRIGFYLPCYWPDASYPPEQMYAEMLEQAILAEDIGLSGLWIPEHHFINYLAHPNPLMSAIKVASVTKRIRLTTSVLVLPFFDIRRLAGEIALADHLTDGRIEIGVGRGAFKYEFDRFGITFEDSRRQFDEALPLLERLLTGYEVSSDTEYYRFPPLTITPRPLQRPHPPIWIAAVTTPAIHHSALKGYNVMTTPLRSPFEEAKEHVDAFFSGAAKSGRTPTPRMAMLRMGYIAKDKADAADKVALAYASDQMHHNLRTADADVRRGMVQRIETGRSHADIANALIIGTPDECLEKLRRYADAGIPELIINMSFGTAHRDVMASLERLAAQVLPEMQKRGSTADTLSA
jgi:alkanesulfonate monooxygenase SsuD/methylene tetrahydromethanopterin reductase-like flavin-dependent oxidoreductase (luciferase family)